MDPLAPHRLIPQRPFRSYRQYREATGMPSVAALGAGGAEAVVSEIAAAGLRGRGGAGFPAGTKWDTLRRHPCPRRSVVMNAAEGEPGTFKDRWILRHNPYAALEGMAIAARVLATDDLRIGIKAGYRVEIARLESAIAEMAEHGVWEGREPVITAGPDEYLFGEEKALLSVLDGGPPLPREAHYPPYEWGLGPTQASPNPALVQNVQTLALVPGILARGAASFRELGTPDTPGTLVVTICGEVRSPGIHEVQAGVPLGELFHGLGGGPLPGRRFRGALSGVSNRVIPAEAFDTPAEFGALAALGSGLGSAGFILLDDRSDLAEVTREVARFLAVESCSQCTACKHGLLASSQALERLAELEHHEASDLARAVEAARSAPRQNRCYLPVQGSVLIPSLVEAFPEDFWPETMAARRAEEREPWRIPKLVDYDPATARFELDPRQACKQPDWSYAPTPPARIRPP